MGIKGKGGTSRKEGSLEKQENKVVQVGSYKKRSYRV